MQDVSGEKEYQKPKQQVETEPEMKPLIAFEGFSDYKVPELTQLSQIVTNVLKLKITAVPTQLIRSVKPSAKSPLIFVISKQGSYTPPDSMKEKVRVVNRQWLEDVQAFEGTWDYSDPDIPLSYGFLFTNTLFFVTGADGSSTVIQKLKRNSGVISDKFESAKSQVIVIENNTSSSLSMAEHSNQVLKRFIKENKITYEHFERLTIVSEQWIDECLKAKDLVPKDPFNLAVLFKIFTQGDRSIFYQATSNAASNKKGQKKPRGLEEQIEALSQNPAD